MGGVCLCRCCRCKVKPEDQDKEPFEFQEYVAPVYDGIYDSIIFTNYYEIIDGGLIDLLVGAILTISTELYDDYEELGEKIGFVFSWIAVLLVNMMFVMEVYTIFTLRKIQQEMDLIVHLKPVSQSLNTKARFYDYVKDLMAKNLIKTERKALRKKKKEEKKKAKKAEKEALK